VTEERRSTSDIISVSAIIIFVCDGIISSLIKCSVMLYVIANPVIMRLVFCKTNQSTLQMTSWDSSYQNITDVIEHERRDKK
jgi:hypothetical protein